MPLIDTHCHLNLILKARPDWRLDQLLAWAEEAEVEHLISISTSLEDTHTLLALGAPFEQISVTAGIHPLNVDLMLCQYGNESLEQSLYQFICHPQIIAVGEIGLDFALESSTRHRTQQETWFEKQIFWANELGKPVIIHCRYAFDRCLEILEAAKLSVPIVVHCFTGDVAIAKKALDIGCFLSLSGILTFKSAGAIQAAAQYAPLNRLLLETDAPYLAPIPMRGKTNHPALIIHVADFLAQLRQCAQTEVALHTTHNARQIFRLPPPKLASLAPGSEPGND